MLATSRDSESWRRRAAITSSWEWFSTMAEGRSPSATVLLLRQCLACGREWASSFLDVIRIQGESTPEGARFENAESSGRVQQYRQHRLRSPGTRAGTGVSSIGRGLSIL